MYKNWARAHYTLIFLLFHFRFGLFGRWFILWYFFKALLPIHFNPPSYAFVFLSIDFFSFSPAHQNHPSFYTIFIVVPIKIGWVHRFFFIHFHSSIYIIIRAHFKDKRFKITASEFDVCFLFSPLILIFFFRSFSLCNGILRIKKSKNNN